MWGYPGGQFAIVMAAASSRPAKDEIAAWTREWLDPFKRNAVTNLRFEAIRGVGDEAIAVVEPADVSRGVVNDGAILLVRRRSQQAIAISAGLAGRDRAEALRLLEQLGSALAARLE